MEKISDFLAGFGLKPAEVSLVLYLMGAGQATIPEIVKATKLKRSTLYFILEQLQAKGLAVFMQKGSHRYYSAASLHEMKQLLQTQKEALESQITTLDKLGPEFAAMIPLSPDKPRITYYEGKAGIREIYDHMLEFEGRPNYYIGDPSRFVEIVGKSYNDKFIARRIAKKIRTKAIWTWPHAHAYAGGEQFLREVRFAPKGFVAPMGIFIYGDCVSLISSAREGFGVIIHSKDYYETMKSWFDMIWVGCSEIMPK